MIRILEVEAPRAPARFFAHQHMVRRVLQEEGRAVPWALELKLAILALVQGLDVFPFEVHHHDAVVLNSAERWHRELALTLDPVEGCPYH